MTVNGCIDGALFVNEAPTSGSAISRTSMSVAVLRMKLSRRNTLVLYA